MTVCGVCQGKGVMIDDAFGIPSACQVCHGLGRLRFTVTDLAPHDHVCFLYEHPASQLAKAVSFIIEGLKQGECCFYVADEHSVETVKETFSRNGVNVKKQINNRALNILTKKESYLSSGHFDPQEMMDYIKDALKAATRAGFLAFRGAGEMTWALGKEPGCDQLMTYEALLEKYVESAKPDMTTLCQYNLRRFSEDKIRSVLHTHKAVMMDTGRVVENPYYNEIMRNNSGSQASQMVDFLRKQANNN